jgi:antitoxin HicB
MKINKKAVGSSFDDFLKEEGDYEKAQAIAVKRVLAWQIQKAMKDMHLVKAEMAKRMHTSRSQLERLLDPANDSVTLSTLARAGHVLGHEIRIELVKRAA